MNPISKLWVWLQKLVELILIVPAPSEIQAVQADEMRVLSHAYETYNHFGVALVHNFNLEVSLLYFETENPPKRVTTKQW